MLRKTEEDSIASEKNESEVLTEEKKEEMLAVLTEGNVDGEISLEENNNVDVENKYNIGTEIKGTDDLNIEGNVVQLCSEDKEDNNNITAPVQAGIEANDDNNAKSLEELDEIRDFSKVDIKITKADAEEVFSKIKEEINEDNNNITGPIQAGIKANNDNNAKSLEELDDIRDFSKVDIEITKADAEEVFNKISEESNEDNNNSNNNITAPVQAGIEANNDNNAKSLEELDEIRDFSKIEIERTKADAEEVFNKIDQDINVDENTVIEENGLEKDNLAHDTVPVVNNIDPIANEDDTSLKDEGVECDISKILQTLINQVEDKIVESHKMSYNVEVMTDIQMEIKDIEDNQTGIGEATKQDNLDSNEKDAGKIQSITTNEFIQEVEADANQDAQILDKTIGDNVDNKECEAILIKDDDDREQNNKLSSTIEVLPDLAHVSAVYKENNSENGEDINMHVRDFVQNIIEQANDEILDEVIFSLTNYVIEVAEIEIFSEFEELERNETITSPIKSESECILHVTYTDKVIGETEDAQHSDNNMATCELTSAVDPLTEEYIEEIVDSMDGNEQELTKNVEENTDTMNQHVKESMTDNEPIIDSVQDDSKVDTSGQDDSEPHIGIDDNTNIETSDTQDSIKLDDDRKSDTDELILNNTLDECRTDVVNDKVLGDTIFDFFNDSVNEENDIQLDISNIEDVEKDVVNTDIKKELSDVELSPIKSYNLIRHKIEPVNDTVINVPQNLLPLEEELKKKRIEHEAVRMVEEARIKQEREQLLLEQEELKNERLKLEVVAEKTRLQRLQEKQADEEQHYLKELEELKMKAKQRETQKAEIEKAKAEFIVKFAGDLMVAKVSKTLIEDVITDVLDDVVDHTAKGLSKDTIENALREVNLEQKSMHDKINLQNVEEVAEGHAGATSEENEIIPPSDVVLRKIKTYKAERLKLNDVDNEGPPVVDVVELNTGRNISGMLFLFI